jgi:predicted DNA-binding transcriptional regulator YafY
MIAADAHTPLDRVRRKLEETFGQFELAQTPAPQIEEEAEDLISKLARGIREHRLVEIEYQKETDAAPSLRTIEPYQLERKLPNWYVHAWDRDSGSEKSFRIDRMRSAKLQRQKFEPRPEFEPSGFSRALTAVVWYSPEVARYELERGARTLVDGSALKEVRYGTDEWLESEILSKRGEAVVLQPADARARIGARAKELAKELGVERMRVKV